MSEPTPTPDAAAPPASRTRGYLVVFALLTLLTVLEVAVVSPQAAVERNTAVATLVLLAFSKAALVALFFMHLRSERPALKKLVLLPFLFPIAAAAVLMLESVWRHR